ncbi:hypothetical protein K504DRAFT_160723 [Pleomassaria siparia CBS 279.74]|uniref:Uncharacterized protein n=1 Tax=Pleomassaria siparia CBS 279.74 TaxID=1314801 RepID=A0A6G1JVC3_9PLEO|nr:hypothetical protein K504DRAFT_160723 [Pleomassaria siparia CBS 279.74]
MYILYHYVCTYVHNRYEVVRLETFIFFPHIFSMFYFPPLKWRIFFSIFVSPLSLSLISLSVLNCSLCSKVPSMNMYMYMYIVHYIYSNVYCIYVYTFE